MNAFIETERLILRELKITDAKGMFEMDSDPLVHRFLGNSPVLNINQSAADIAFIQVQYKENGIGRWAVIEKHSDQFIGWSGLKLIKDINNNHSNYYDIGYRLNRKFWGKGYATESAKAAIDYGFKELNLVQIIGIADVENKDSIHVLEKLGLQKINVFDYKGRDHHWFKIDNYRK
ncbi:GNAT family N-acetyltransferase [Pedobacter agri]|uniref:GNAT family N-acetyltransferase n=1 Tax=Pedobacter agri TaxID=454586 RepID=UPI00292DA718|nr:GNAT family N-acetyltransferase [Pedobacter agri]